MFNLNVTEQDSALDIALAYAEHGLSVVPLHRHNKVPTKELGGWQKFQERQPTTEEIEKWFKGRDDVVVALVCGKFIVVDADTAEAVNWVEANLPITPFKVATGKGVHYYYNNPENFTTWVARRVDGYDPAKLIDIRGVGGLIVAPHNIHATGAIYTPITIPDWDLNDVEDLPDFTKELWVKVTGVEKAVDGQPISTPLSIDGVTEGSRNDQAARLAGFLIAKGLNANFTEFFVQSWNAQNKPPLPVTEVSTVVNSIQKTHDRKTQQAPSYISGKRTVKEPANLYSPPGVLKDIYDYSEKIAQISQPAISMQAALSLGSVALGRMYKTNMNNFSSLFFMCIAKSGQGKENVKTVVENILDQAEYSDLMAGDGYTSSGAIYSLLRYKPTHITVMDEFGKRLESISKSSNSNKEDAIQVLMETWGRCHGILRPDNYSMMTLNQKQQKEAMDRSTIKPAITLVGMSVPKNFYGALSTGRIVDGFLNRFIVVESNVPRTVGRMVPFVEPPQSTSDWVSHVRQVDNEMEQISRDNAELDFKSRILTFDDDSNNLFEKLAYRLVDEQNILEKEGLEVLLSRTREKAMRLALIGALADDRQAKVIKGDITQWAIDYVYYYDQLLVENCKDKVAGSEMEGRIKQVLSFIRSQGEWGISKRDIDRREIFRSMKSYEVKEIIERLKNSGEIQEKDLRAKGTGRPTKRIVAIDPEFLMKIDRLALKETLSDVSVGIIIAFPLSFFVLNVCNYLNLSLVLTSVIQTTVFTFVAIIRKYCVRIVFKKEKSMDNPKPKMENINDQKREERVAGFIEGLWNVRCHKLPVSYGLDYWCESQDTSFWLEVKCRTFGIDKYDTLLLSSSKLRMGSALSLATNQPFLIVYAMTDSVYSHTWKRDHVYDVRFGTIAEPIYEEDSEPYIHFSKEELDCLSPHPLGFDREEMGLVNNYKKGS